MILAFYFQSEFRASERSQINTSKTANWSPPLSHRKGTAETASAQTACPQSLPACLSSDLEELP